MEWVQIRKEKNTFLFFFFCYSSFQGWVYVELLQWEPVIACHQALGLTGSSAQLSNGFLWLHLNPEGRAGLWMLLHWGTHSSLCVSRGLFWGFPAREAWRSSPAAGLERQGLHTSLHLRECPKVSPGPTAILVVNSDSPLDCKKNPDFQSLHLILSCEFFSIIFAWLPCVFALIWESESSFKLYSF